MTTPSSADQEARLARLASTMTQVPAEELRSQSLHMRLCEDPKCAQCFRSSMTLGPEPIEIVHCPVINRASVAAGGKSESMDASSPAEALSLYLKLWRIVTHRTLFGDELPCGIRNEDGFICTIYPPTYYLGQNERYKEECEEMRRHAETMCAALNQQVTG